MSMFHPDAWMALIPTTTIKKESRLRGIKWNMTPWGIFSSEREPFTWTGESSHGVFTKFLGFECIRQVVCRTAETSSRFAHWLDAVILSYLLLSTSYLQLYMASVFQGWNIWPVFRGPWATPFFQIFAAHGPTVGTIKSHVWLLGRVKKTIRNVVQLLSDPLFVLHIWANPILKALKHVE